MRQEFVYEFGPFKIRTDDRLLSRDGAPVRVPPKAVDLLLALIESDGRVVKEDLVKKVWPDSVVTESSLTYQMHVLRDALGDTGSTAKYIETVPRRGYKFVAEVTVSHAEQPAARGLADSPSAPIEDSRAADTPSGQTTDPSAIPAQEGIPARRARAGRTVVVAGSAIVLALVLGLASELRTPPVPRIVSRTRLTNGVRVEGTGMATDGRFLAFSDYHGGWRLRIDEPGGEPLPFEGFHLLDMSLKRREALAIRPKDHGAENGLWIVPLDGDPPRRLGMTLASWATWSRDGNHIAYTYQRDLYVADPDGTQVRKVGTFAGELSWIRWSPDDSKLRLTLTATADRSNPSTLWDVDVETGRTWRVFDNPTHRECCGGWLPNGRDYVFVSGGATDSQVWLVREGRGLFTSGRQRLVQLTSGTGGFHAALPSIDGKRIFVVTSPQPHLARYDVGAGAFMPYLGGILALNVEFSRTGEHVIYITQLDHTLWLARADGANPQQLVPASLKVDSASWSPDGKWIALRGQSQGSRTKIYIVPSTGGPAQPLVSDDVEQGTPSWSKDGTQIAFGDVPETFGRPTGSEVIHVYDRPSRTFRVLAGSNLLWSSRWSPDGRYIAALTIKGQSLMVHDLVTGQWRSLGVDHVGSVTWSADGKYIYCDQEGSETWARRIRVEDGSVERLVDMGGLQRGNGTGLALDGAPLFLLAPTDIYALELEYR